MTKLEIFDPPMCCSTGICGSSADPILVVFASDLEWLKKQGVEVERHVLTLKPSEFTKNEAVNHLIKQKGESCLPIFILEGKIVYDSSYPSREELARLCNIAFNEDEAPPIHREENCCCGVDCDCRIPQSASNQADNCDCTNAAFEDNCFCTSSSNYSKPAKTINFPKIALIIATIIIFGIIILKIFFK